jgi:hypothetical protein
VGCCCSCVVVAVVVTQGLQILSPNTPLNRYESNSGGEREIQRTMLELLNQLDGFDSRGDVKVFTISCNKCTGIIECVVPVHCHKLSLIYQGFKFNRLLWQQTG